MQYPTLLRVSCTQMSSSARRICEKCVSARRERERGQKKAQAPSSRRDFAAMRAACYESPESSPIGSPAVREVVRTTFGHAHHLTTPPEKERSQKPT